MSKLIIILWILFALYSSVLLVVMADLWSGVKKARRLGIIRTSYSFRRTVEKLSKYLNMMLPLTVIDTMQMVAIWYMDRFYSIQIPLFPFITLLGALGISLIEIKSIYEKAEDKEKVLEVRDLIAKIITNKRDLKMVTKLVKEYIKNNTEKTKEE